MLFLIFLSMINLDKLMINYGYLDKVDSVLSR